MITINTRGARTLADARPLVYGGQNVYVTFSHGHSIAQLHLGGLIVAERPASEVQTVKAAQDWAYETIEAAEALVSDNVKFVERDPQEEILTLVDALGGTYTSRDKSSQREVTYSAGAVIRKLRDAFRRGAQAQVNDAADGASWYIEINNGRGSSYGQYFFDGS